MANETQNEVLDYRRLWKTLLRLGIKQRFSDMRLGFFMKIASEGPVKYKGKEDLDKIIKESTLFNRSDKLDTLVEQLKHAIGPEDEFKHYTYYTEDGLVGIEYFANVTTPFTKDFINFVSEGMADGADADDIDGYEMSCIYEENGKPEEDGSIPIIKKIGSLVLIAEASDSINPDNYPAVIKHELSHICLFEILSKIARGYYKYMPLPATWTDEEFNNWENDVNYLFNVLKDRENKESHNFTEFVAEFLMYESDGQTKERNPVKESRAPKTTNPNSKPKVTYRTLTPIDRFIEYLDTINEDDLHQCYAKIASVLKDDYDEYDKFLDDIKMPSR